MIFFCFARLFILPTNSWVELGLHIVIALLKVHCVFWWASTHAYRINASILVFRLGEGGECSKGIV